jgi:NADH:ubiquinone oxidoreductase subunit 6 (subunit J)
MNSSNKFLLTAAFAGLFALVLIGLYADYGMDAADREASEEEPVPLSDALWSDYAWAALVIGIIIFAGAVGVLALVGGETKWR